MKKFVIIILSIMLCGFYSLVNAQESRFMNHTEVGVLPYNLTFKEVGMAFQTFNGYKLNRDIAVGATVGFEKYFVDRNNEFFVIPAELGVRYAFLDPQGPRLLANLDAGYGFAWEKKADIDHDIKGGLRLNPSLAVKWKLGESNTFMTFGVGYQYQKFKGKNFAGPFIPIYYDSFEYYPKQDYSNKSTINAHRIAIKVGFGF